MPFSVFHPLSAEQAVEDVKANPAVVSATLRVLGYPADRRPFYAVHSGDRNEVEAWLALRDRPQDINQQMTTWLYTAFSLACEEGRCEMAEMLIEKGADTS